MPRRPPRDRARRQRLALERIEALRGEVLRAVHEDRPDRARRYLTLARRLAQRARVSVPRDVSRLRCRGCGGALVPGRTLRVRVGGRRVTRTCLDCGAVHRVPTHQRRKTT